MRTAATSDLWFKSAVIYCLQVRNFGGDLGGLIERLDHVAGLGATCVWIMPLYPSPGRDDGYDITDHFAVDPRFGDLGELTEVLRHAHDRGLRVILDLVPNHTSIEHPWFREHPEFYVWADEPDERGPATGRSTPRAAGTTCTHSRRSNRTSRSPTRTSAPASRG